MTQENKDYKQKIDELLSHYTEGRDIFKNAKDWDHPLVRVPGAENAAVPENWLELVEHTIGILAHDKYGLKTYPNEIAVIDYEQMLDLYSTVGLPVGYDHWSIGMDVMQQKQQYKAGEMGLAYEIVINTSPSISYCMAQNTPVMQMLVIAHAAFGHNSFFKNNHLFRQFTNAEEILPMMMRLRDDIKRYEQRFGVREVTRLIDAAHALEDYGVNRYGKPPRRSPEEEQARRAKIEEIRQQNYNPVIERVGASLAADFAKTAVDIPADLEENLLRFIASDAPHLLPWQRNLLTQFADKAQYFYPQKQTQLMNEGWASFWHYTLMTEMREMDLISPGMYMEFLHSHANVLTQRDFDQPGGGSINPYALGFAIFRDIRRMCENPTDEDRKWFPNVAGKDWLPTLMNAMESHKDESFVLQYLSPKVIRDFKLFSFRDDAKDTHIKVTAIHDDDGYKQVREDLASQYRLADRELQIEVAKYNYKTDRALTLQHTIRNGVPINEQYGKETLKHLFQLWGHSVIMHSVEDSVIRSSMAVPEAALRDAPKPGQKMTYN
jgi:stage V sporulation protein R